MGRGFKIYNLRDKFLGCLSAAIHIPWLACSNHKFASSVQGQIFHLALRALPKIFLLIQGVHFFLENLSKF